MALKRFALLALVLLALPACRSALYNPDPFKAASTTKNAEKAIKTALASRGWLISQEEPGKIYATLARKSHVARIVISYGDTVTIRYAGSDNLKYDVKEDGTEVIHKRYNKWIHTLVADINRYMLLGSD